MLTQLLISLTLVTSLAPLHAAQPASANATAAPVSTPSLREYTSITASATPTTGSLEADTKTGATAPFPGQRPPVCIEQELRPFITYVHESNLDLSDVDRKRIGERSRDPYILITEYALAPHESTVIPAMFEEAHHLQQLLERIHKKALAACANYRMAIDSTLHDALPSELTSLAADYVLPELDDILVRTIAPLSYEIVHEQHMCLYLATLMVKQHETDLCLYKRRRDVWPHSNADHTRWQDAGFRFRREGMHRDFMQCKICHTKVTHLFFMHGRTHNAETLMNPYDHHNAARHQTSRIDQPTFFGRFTEESISHNPWGTQAPTFHSRLFEPHFLRHLNYRASQINKGDEEIACCATQWRNIHNAWSQINSGWAHFAHFALWKKEKGAAAQEAEQRFYSFKNVT